MIIRKSLLAVLDVLNQPISIIVNDVEKKDIGMLKEYNLRASIIDGDKTYVGNLTASEVNEIANKLQSTATTIDHVRSVPRSQH